MSLTVGQLLAISVLCISHNSLFGYEGDLQLTFNQLTVSGRKSQRLCPAVGLEPFHRVVMCYSTPLRIKRTSSLYFFQFLLFF